MDEHKINYCMGCMSPLADGRKCSKCGFDFSTYNVSKRCLAPGTILAGRYMAGRVIGEGGFGITYIGRDLVLDIVIAVKEYFPLACGVRGSRECKDNTIYVNQDNEDNIYQKGLDRFYKEAKILSQFHMLEGIVLVRDFFYENQTAYIVMDYINGINLKKYVKENGKIPGDKALQLMQPVIQSLGVIHQAGIIHRDISPDNLIMAEDGRLVLVDFGSAQIEEGNITRSITVMFKRGFTPEEQYTSRGKQGAWTDIYALCATIYYMLTGIVPDEAVERMLDDKLEGLSGFPDINISGIQKDAVMRGISVKPEERFQTTQELYDILYNEDKVVLNSTEQKDIRKHYFKVITISCVIIISGYFIIPGLLPETGRVQPVSKSSSYSTVTPAVNVINKGPVPSTQASENIKMQLFTGLTKKQAEEHLAKSGDKYLKIDWKEKYNSKVTKGTVISQNIPANTSYFPGSIKKIVLTISLGTKMVKVPDVTGQYYENAVRKLKNRKLKYKLTWEENTKEKGTVILQDKKAGKYIKPGKKVHLTVSSGIKATPVPAPTPVKQVTPEETPVPERTKAPGKKPAGKKTGTDISEPNIFIGVIP